METSASALPRTSPRPEGEKKSGMKLGTILRRFLTPGFVVTLQGLSKFGAKISPKAEVEVTPNLRIGRKSVVSSWVKIKSEAGPLYIGSNVEISNFCVITSHTAGSYIGDDPLIGPHGPTTANTHSTTR